MNIALLALATLLPFEGNPRVADASDHDSLLASIKAFGLFKPLLVWQGDDHPEGETAPIVIGGNQRLHTLKAAAQAGLFRDGPLRVTLKSGAVVEVDPEALPCIRFPGSWAEAKVVALRDNAQEGEWDWEALPGYVKGLEDLFPEGDLDLTLTGFDAATLRDLEALVTDPLVGLDRITGDGGDDDEDDDQGSGSGEGDGGKAGSSSSGKDDTSSLTRQSAKVVIGNIRGKIPVGLYERLATVIKDASKRLDTTDLTVILSDLTDKLEGKPAPKAKGPKAKGPKAPLPPAKE